MSGLAAAPEHFAPTGKALTFYTAFITECVRRLPGSRGESSARWKQCREKTNFSP